MIGRPKGATLAEIVHENRSWRSRISDPEVGIQLMPPPARVAAFFTAMSFAFSRAVGLSRIGLGGKHADMSVAFPSVALQRKKRRVISIERLPPARPIAVAQKLTPGNLPAVIEIASLPDQIRGYTKKIRSDSIALVKSASFRETRADVSNPDPVLK
jgi:hypothetical protein